MRAADGRMPGERQLLPRREDAKAIVRLRGFQQERGFGKVRPAGDAAHRLRIEAISPDHHRDQVAEERLVGKDVDLRELHEPPELHFKIRSRL